MSWTVEITYPAPISRELDDLLDRLATRFRGHWLGSGVGLVAKIPDRDIEFQFPNEAAARSFSAECNLLAIIQVRTIREE